MHADQRDEYCGQAHLVGESPPVLLADPLCLSDRGQSASVGPIRADVSHVLALADQAEAEGWSHARFRSALSEIANPVAATVSNAPAWSNGRRPKFWRDIQVRTLLVSLHREMTIADARAVCEAQFGAARTPSHSAIGRCWQQIDRIAGKKD